MSPRKRKAAAVAVATATAQPQSEEGEEDCVDHDNDDDAPSPTNDDDKNHGGPSSRARLLANPKLMRIMLRKEDLLTYHVTRSGVMEPVAMVSACLMEDFLSQAAAAATSKKDGRVEWTAIRQAVSSSDHPLAQAVADSLPETIAVDKSTRHHVNQVMRQRRTTTDEEKNDRGTKKGNDDGRPQKKRTTTRKKALPAATRRKSAAAAVAAAASVGMTGVEEGEPLEIIEDEEEYD